MEGEVLYAVLIVDEGLEIAYVSAHLGFDTHGLVASAFLPALITRVGAAGGQVFPSYEQLCAVEDSIVLTARGCLPTEETCIGCQTQLHIAYIERLTYGSIKPISRVVVMAAQVILASAGYLRSRNTCMSVAMYTSPAPCPRMVVESGCSISVARCRSGDIQYHSCIGIHTVRLTRRVNRGM